MVCKLNFEKRTGFARTIFHGIGSALEFLRAPSSPKPAAHSFVGSTRAHNNLPLTRKNAIIESRDSKSRRRPVSRGFTIVELLIVVVILAVLAALLFPALASAKRSAKTTASIGNLRNVYLALGLYVSTEDPSGATLPEHDVAFGLVPPDVRCSPLKTWNVDCRTYSGAPLIGSYGYIRGIQQFQDERRYRNFFGDKGRVHAIAIDIFAASNPPEFFPGDQPKEVDSTNFGRYLMPDRTLRLKSDGSIKIVPEAEFLPKDGYEVFSWTTLFFRDLHNLEP